MTNVQELIINWSTGKLRKKVFAQLDKSYTYGEFGKAVLNSVQFLRSKGLKAGSRVIISTRQPYPVAVIFWACLHEGIIAILLDPDIGPQRAEGLITLTGCDFMIVDTMVIKRWNLTNKSLAVLSISSPVKKKSKLLTKMLKKSQPSTNDSPGFWNTMITYAEQHDKGRTVGPEDIAYILFTSGSTATSKAVQISYRALWANLTTIKEVYELNDKSRILNILTVYHTDGVIQGPVLSGFIGGGWYHPFDFSMDRLPQLFDSFYKYQISHFITVPTMLKLMYELGDDYADAFDYPEFHSAVTSAAPFEIALWESFEERFGITVANNYGLTETVVGASYCGPIKKTYSRGSIGLPVDCTFKIVDQNDAVLSTGNEGELLIKGDNLFSSYLNNEKATKAAFIDGWFRTGDLAMQDADGFYYLKGRIKNLIICGGINIQPEEVSAVLNTHPAVNEAACLGKADDVFGQLPVAIVVLHPGQEITASVLAEHCRKELEEIKIPRQIIFADQIPKTGSGKIKYADLNKLVQSGKLQVSNQENADTGYRQIISSAAAEAFKTKLDTINFEKASTLTIDGWDSLAHLAFITRLEEKLKIRFSSKEIMQITSLNDTERILKRKL